ncbi:MAG: ABC transporter permease [Thermoproteota archaeon]
MVEVRRVVRARLGGTASEWLSKLSEFISFVRMHTPAKAGIAILAVLVGIAVFAPYIAPYNPNVRVAEPMLPPSREHLLGTNDMGQDIFSELIYGARISLFIGFIAALIGTMLGTTIGIVAGYKGGIVDEVLMRLTDMWLSMPTLLFTIFLVAVFSRLPRGTIMMAVIMAIALTSWPSVARLIRSSVLRIKEEPYIEAAIAVGVPHTRIMFRHILPNVTPLIVIEVITRTAIAMLTESSLAFLGLGDPTAKSWGMIIYYAMRRNALYLGLWWWFIPPGLMISIAVLSVMLIGLGLEEYFNPRLRRGPKI